MGVLGMILPPRRRNRIRAVAAALALLGLLLWVIAAVAPADAQDVTVDHIMDRSLGVVVGGGSIVGGIALLVVAS
jgi:heme O synthase-like polyprenyltransferase